MTNFVGSAGGGGGLATDGLDPTNWIGPLPGFGGGAVTFPENINDRGGSGGGAGGGWFRFQPLSGGDGGGAGGGIVAASSLGSITVDGLIRANGANGGTSFANAFGWGGPGGGGSGGVIDLQADSIVVNGTLEAVGGEGGGIGTVQPGNPNFSSNANGGLGFIRLTSNDITLAGTTDGELITRDFDVRQTISVQVLSDMLVEPGEMFHVDLTAPVNALFADNQGLGTILDSIGEPGDFDLDGVYDVDDIDALVAAIAGGTHPGEFDVTGDGVVNLADRDGWLALAGAANLPSGNAYLVGDANLDGAVDGLDFIAWNDNKFTSVAAWSAADFNASGSVDGQDFIIWNDNKFMTADLGGLMGRLSEEDRDEKDQEAALTTPVAWLPFSPKPASI